MNLNDTLLDLQAERQRRARIRDRAADRAQAIGVHHSVRRALVPLHATGDSLDAFDRALARNAAHNDTAFRAFSLARRLRHESLTILLGGAA